MMLADLDRDAELVEAARDGSLTAFDALVDRYRGAIVRLAFQMTHDLDEANDVAQDTFLRAFSRLDSYHPDRPFARWLFVIARNAALDALRRRKRTAPLDSDGEAMDLGPEELAVRNDEAGRVHAALASLPSKHREALELYYLSGLRYREIADALHIPIGTVKTHISRAKRRLRDNLDLVTTRLAA